MSVAVVLVDGGGGVGGKWCFATSSIEKLELEKFVLDFAEHPQCDNSNPVPLLRILRSSQYKGATRSPWLWIIDRARDNGAR
jgi:hypothetical protein